MKNNDLSNGQLTDQDKDKQTMVNDISGGSEPKDDIADKDIAIEEVEEEDIPVNPTRKHKSNGGNLVNFKDNTKEKQREIALMGAKASAEARRRRKSLRESLEALLEKGTTQDDICVALVNKAKNGSYRAYSIGICRKRKRKIGEKGYGMQNLSYLTQMNNDRASNIIGTYSDLYNGLAQAGGNYFNALTGLASLQATNNTKIIQM